MSELMRFRLARAPQKRAVAPEVGVPLYRTPPAGHEVGPRSGNDDGPFFELLTDARSSPRKFEVGFESDGVTVLGKPARLATPVGAIDRWLTGRANRATDKQLGAKLNALCQSVYDVHGASTPKTDDLGANARLLMQKAGNNWWLDRQNLGFSLLLAMYWDSEPDRAVYLNRLMLVLGLVELAATNPARLKTAADVHWALRSRFVILPQTLLGFLRSLRPQSMLARRPGFSDLYVVRDEWARYEAGEIAYVENVMASETRERSHTRTEENEETTTSEQERTSVEERDAQSTDRFDLHQETSRDASLNIGIEGSVDASGQYGTASIRTHLGGNLDYSIDESQSQATTSAHEIVARAVTRVEDRVREARTMRSLSRVEEVNKHSFKNDGADAEHISGIYRWVDKIKRVQVFRYPNRFLLEFQVPEPGAWLRWLLDQKKPGALSEQPQPFTKAGTAGSQELTAGDVTATGYSALGARYKALGLTPPPGDKVIATAVTRPAPEPAPDGDKEPIRFQMDKQLAVPAGYKATTWTAVVQSWHNGSFGTAAASVNLAVGSGPTQNATSAQYAALNAQLTGSVGSVSDGTIPISLMTDSAYGYNVNITVTCTPLPEELAAWQIETYGKIAEAYYAMKRQYDEEMAAQRVRSGVQIQGLSPAQNEQMARAEIKKAVIAMLRGENLAGCDGYRLGPGATRLVPPEVDLMPAAKYVPEIQFMEQAFEWENMTYVLYPYFWARKDQWDQLADLSGADPDLARFLRAGSARVVLPARPGFELQVWMYASLGILWGTPAPGEEDYLSIADEIRAQEQPPRDGIAGEAWEVRLPTTLIWLDTVNSSLPVDNPAMHLDAPPGHALP